MGSFLRGSSSRDFAKRFLAMTHLLGPAKGLRDVMNRRRTIRYWGKVVSLYRDPRSRPYESFDDLEQIKRSEEVASTDKRWDDDRMFLTDVWLAAAEIDRIETLTRKVEEGGGASSADERTTVLHALATLHDVPTHALVSLPEVLEQLNRTDREGATFAVGRETAARLALDRLIEDGRVPRYYDYDHIDDLVPIVRSRYSKGQGIDHERSEPLLRALTVLGGAPAPGNSADAARWMARLLGPDHSYVPRRGVLNRYVSAVIPDLVEEFAALRAEDNIGRFLEINREYSRRQQQQQGRWDNRDLALLRGHEHDHLLLLRTLVRLRTDKKLVEDDEALIVGPRHADELVFFRKHLRLPKTSGLDLFADPDAHIVAGDMHDMPFDSGRFKLVFCAGTLSYAYHSRKVISEIARVLQRPGYAFLMDAGDRHAGPDPLGRSDTVNITTAIGFFHEHRSTVLASDRGRSLAPHVYTNNPCLAIRLE